MTALDPQALAADDAAVDELMRRHNHVEPPEDPSGLLGAPTPTTEDEAFEAYMRRHFGVAVQAEPAAATPAPQPAVPVMPEIAQGPRGAAADDDAAMVDAWCARYFPGSVGSKT